MSATAKGRGGRAISTGRARALASIALAISMGACASLHGAPAVPSPSARAELPALLAQAAQDVLAGRYGVADRTLAEFVQRYPDSVEAADATMARALYKLDPANQVSTQREAITLLDGIAASTALDATHRANAAALRRAAQSLADRSAAGAPVTAQAAPAAPGTAADKAKDEELARVKEELAKANAELERIKRRLAAPKP